MNYRDALHFFRNRSDYDRGFISNPFAGDDAAAAGLKRTRLLLDEIGSPDAAYPIIHVAGTKGKGSTCAFIEAVARRAGRTTGMFVTPQLHSVRERTLVNGDPITEEQYAQSMARVASAVARVESAHPAAGGLTAFEISTAQALLVFADEQVDLAIIEVGLGGRLDATNVVTPKVSVITPVSFDHEAILGDTLDQIASEKAGIIKPGIPVVVGHQEPEALATIVDFASRQGSPLVRADEGSKTDRAIGIVSLTGPWGTLDDVKLGLRGPHQVDNARTALMVLWRLDPDLLSNPESVRAGLEATTWPGRFEQISGRPLVIADGAHNVASIEVLVVALLKEFGEAQYDVVFGSYRDKDLSGMLRALAPLSPHVIGTRSSSPRAREPDEVSDTAASLGLSTETASSVGSALDIASRRANTETVIVLTGSLSIVAEAREYFGLAAVSDVEREILSR